MSENATIPVPREGPALFLGRRESFWRCAASAGLSAMAFALFSWAGPSIQSPGVMPCLLLGLAILVAGPSRELAAPSPAGRLGRLVCLLVLCWPVIQAGFAAVEREAAVLSLPCVAFAACAAMMGWRLQQQDEHAVPVTLAGAGVLRLMLAPSPISPGEAAWWVVVLVWLAVVLLFRPAARAHFEESPPLLAGVAWFVLTVTALTVQEMSHARREFFPPDMEAALEAWRAHPLLGWGAGSFDRAFLEFATRDPASSPATATGALRLAAELGLAAPLALAFGATLLFAGAVRSREWTPGRVQALGAAGFWAVASLSICESYWLPLAAAAFAFPGTLGRPALPVEVKSEDFLPNPLWTPWLLAVAAGLGAALLPVTAAWHYERQNPLENMAAHSFVPAWTEPLRDREWMIRAKSAEMALYTDPRKHLRPVIDAWLRAAPHDELAHIARIRLHANDPKDKPAAEQAALDAHARLPWSEPVAAWAVRLQLEQGKNAEAIRFLEELKTRRKRLSPALSRRLLDLRSAQDRTP